jgi:hypothetical protein
MTRFSLRTAAQQVGVSKSTVLRGLQTGRLSGTRTEAGGWEIDASELFRVYPPKGAPGAPHQSVTRPMGHGAPPDDAAPGAHDPALNERLAALDAEVRLLRELIGRADREADDLRAQRDAWRVQAQAALSDQRTARPWWRRVIGG